MKFNIRCNAVSYRQGFIEVSTQIHEGCINIETWEVSSEKDISSVNVRDDSLSDEDIVSNTELELRPAEAIALAEALLSAAGNTAEEK